MRGAPSATVLTTTPTGGVNQMNVANRTASGAAIAAFDIHATGGLVRLSGFSSVGSSSYCTSGTTEVIGFSADN